MTGACELRGEQPYRDYIRPAHFKVTNEVINGNVEAFTATIGGFGNSLINEGSGFEPVVFRTRYTALEKSPDRVIASPLSISHYDTLREGALDGADVYIYRIENSRFRLVRQDRIPEGGFHVSGYMPVLPDNAILPKGINRFVFRWDDYNRPKASYYFSVRAVDRAGNLSPYSDAVAVERPTNVGQGESRNSVQDFQPSRTGSDSNQPPAPTNLHGTIQGDGSLLFEWDPVKADDLAGYIVYRSDYSPENHKGYFLQLSRQASADSDNVKAGDMVIVSKRFYSASRKRYHSNRVWNASNENQLFMPGLLDFFPDESANVSWELVRHAPDSPVEAAGETCLKLEVREAASASIATYNHSGTEQDWYDVLEPKPYRVEVWLRQEGAGKVVFKLNGFYGDGPNLVAPIEFRPGKQWQKFTATFTPPVIQPGKAPNQMALEFTGPGTFFVDNFRVFRDDSGYLDYLPEQYAELKASGMGALRTHGLIKPGRHTYDIDQLTNPGGVISGTAKLNTLPQTLQMMKRASVQPWLQIAPHLSPAEWLALVEYLAAPYDSTRDTQAKKPWAYKRFSQGQTRPWTEEFDRIYFELGNETWNSLFHPWTFEEMTDGVTGRGYSAGQVYGLYQEYVRSVMQQSPYWEQSGLGRKLTFMLGGWNGQSYGHEAATVSPSAGFMNLAAYNGGWDEGEGPPSLGPASFFNLLNHVSSSTIPSAERHAREVGSLNAKRGYPLRVGTYEAGPGYALNGLNNAAVSDQQAAEQEKVMKSLAAGTATLDSFLARAYQGFSTQNFFTFGAGTYWKSHAHWYDGGQAYPAWKLLSLFNSQGTGDMLATKALDVPTVNLKAFDRRRQIERAPSVAVYATRKGARYNVFVLSRKVADFPFTGDDGHTPVTIDLPFKTAASVTLYRMAGDPRANNIRADNVSIEKINLQAKSSTSTFVLNRENGADARGLPPGSAFLYVFEGTR